MLSELETQALREHPTQCRLRTARHVIDPPAMRAHSMMVVAGRAEKVCGLAVHLRHRDQTQSAQCLEHAINGCQTDPGRARTQLAVKLPRRDIFFLRSEFPQNRFALFGHAVRGGRKFRLRSSERLRGKLFHRVRPLVRRASSSAPSSERRLGETAMATKKQAVATSTMVAPDATLK